MFAQKNLALGQSAAAAAANYIEDVFSTYLFSGVTGGTQTITNGIDLLGKGGLVWNKLRSGADNNYLVDSARGTSKYLIANDTAAEATQAQFITAFNNNGFSFGTAGYTSGTVVSWTFREQAKFFDVVTYTGNGTSQNIAHNLGAVPGCIIVKQTSNTSNWMVYHRSLANTEALFLNLTNAKATGSSAWNSTTPTSTVFSVGANNNVNASGESYVAYLFAHDAGGFGASGTDNVISCGSFTSDGSGNATINLGYEPQWILLKTSAVTDAWYLYDTMRGITAIGSGGNAFNAYLNPNVADAESTTTLGAWSINQTGFAYSGGFSNRSYIYIAIRRGPMKTPTSGTSVFTPNVSTTTDITGETFTVGFPPDSVWPCRRNASSKFDYDRLRGENYLVFNTTGAENNLAGIPFDQQNSFKPTYNFYQGSPGVVLYSFRRAPGFFDVVCYTGTGANRTVTHNLGVVPELMIVKRRETANAWAVYANNDNTDYLVLNTNAATADDNTYWNDTSPTASVFSVGTNNAVNASGSTYVAYLFASVSGVSKVGSYTGNGSNQTINCGFTAGARFVMIKRTDSTGDWYVWDSARGIVAGDDPYLLLNDTSAEVTNTDYVDTANVGFEITSTAPAAINANGGSFIFFAVA